jgi:hypothetical protein
MTHSRNLITSLTSLFFNLFFKILTCYSPADFRGWFQLKGESRKTFNIIVSTKSVFSKFQYGRVAAARQPPVHFPSVRHSSYPYICRKIWAFYDLGIYWRMTSNFYGNTIRLVTDCSLTLELVRRWRWLVRFTPRPFYPKEFATVTHWIGGS